MAESLHIIHLNHRKDRMALLERELKKQCISVCLWPGIPDPENPKRGISQAHKQIVQYAQRESLPYITIAEDDIYFTDQGAYDYFLQHIPADYDLYLGSIYYGNLQSDHSVTDFAGLTIYRIHQKFYSVFLAADEQQNLDRALAGKGKFIVCDPFIALQHNGYSDHQKCYVNYKDYIKDKKLYSHKG